MNRVRYYSVIVRLDSDNRMGMSGHIDALRRALGRESRVHVMLTHRYSLILILSLGGQDTISDTVSAMKNIMGSRAFEVTAVSRGYAVACRTITAQGQEAQLEEEQGDGDCFSLDDVRSDDEEPDEPRSDADTQQPRGAVKSGNEAPDCVDAIRDIADRLARLEGLQDAERLCRLVRQMRRLKESANRYVLRVCLNAGYDKGLAFVRCWTEALHQAGFTKGQEISVVRSVQSSPEPTPERSAIGAVVLLSAAAAPEDEARENRLQQLADFAFRKDCALFIFADKPEEQVQIEKRLGKRLLRVDFSRDRGDEMRTYIGGLLSKMDVRASNEAVGKLVRYAGDSIDGMRDIIEIAQVNAVARGAGEALIEPEDVREGCGFQHIEASPEKAIERINGLIGQTDAKKAIIQIGCDLKLQRLRQSEGLRAQQKCMHMLFTGNPGTGKTTFARLISEYFRELGLLSRGKFMEVSRANLIGMYSGWTIKNTKECFNDADGGVLFVDEAPTLISSESDGYGREALNQICYEMENRRRDMIVIFAGYQDQMDKLLAENPGLRDRFAYRIHFKDYAQPELEAIMQLQLRQSGMELDSGAWELAARYIADMLRAKSSEFGNGRSVRRLVERMGLHQAERIVLRQEKDYRRITAEDVAEALGDPDMRIIQKPQSRTIGFGGTAGK